MEAQDSSTLHCQYYNTRGKGTIASRTWLPVWLNQVTGKEHWQQRRPKNGEMFDTLIQRDWFVTDSFKLDGRHRIPLTAIKAAAASGRVQFGAKLG